MFFVLLFFFLISLVEIVHLTIYKPDVTSWLTAELCLRLMRLCVLGGTSHSGTSSWSPLRHLVPVQLGNDTAYVALAPCLFVSACISIDWSRIPRSSKTDLLMNMCFLVRQILIHEISVRQLEPEASVFAL